MNRTLGLIVSTLWLCFSLTANPAQAADWPRTLELGRGNITIYSPQVDQLDDGVIEFRAALAWRETDDSDPVFGAGWFRSEVEIDAASGKARPVGPEVVDLRFPSGAGVEKADLSSVLSREAALGRLDFELNDVEESLRTARAEATAADGLNTAPPRIIYRDHPAILVSLDGDPLLRAIEDSPFEAVINTPWPLIFDGRHYYLNAARDVWYRSGQAAGPYHFEPNPPAEVTGLVKPEDSGAAGQSPAAPVTADNAPEIVVTTEPAELIVTEGPAAFVPLVDDLLVLQNSDDDVFMHVSSQQFYIVLAGRWYRSGSLAGPWTFQPADELPAAFGDIPLDSEQADSRVHVAGTEEAREAVLDAQVPKTAAIARGQADIEVEYDGQPRFEPVDGADLNYAVNTGSTVIQSANGYYLVEDGVWYRASSPHGPWQVSDHRPSQLASVTPESPVYNVKYVYVYDSTPEVVYVGYTPGYLGNYVYRETVFYGSGWYYAPWTSPRYYYPRHGTWGFHVRYDPWWGWNFSLSWGWGPFSFAYWPGGYWHHHHHWHHRHFGRWGPGRYRPHPVHHGRRGDWRHGREPRVAQRDEPRDLYRDAAQRAAVIEDRADFRRPGTDKFARSRIQPVRASELRDKARRQEAVNRPVVRRTQRPVESEPPQSMAPWVAGRRDRSRGTPGSSPPVARVQPRIVNRNGHRRSVAPSPGMAVQPVRPPVVTRQQSPREPTFNAPLQPAPAHAIGRREAPPVSRVVAPSPQPVRAPGSHRAQRPEPVRAAPHGGARVTEARGAAVRAGKAGRTFEARPKRR